MKVLVIEDDMCYASNLSAALKKNQIDCDVCYYGNEGFELIDGSNYDIVLIDLLLPDMDGDDLVKRIRNSSHKNIPIIILSARDDIATKVELFSSGADDYIIKPHVTEELIMRLFNVFRRSNNFVTNKIFIAPGLTLDTKSKTITIDNKILDLTATEFALLEHMIINKDNVLKKETIIDKLYCNSFDNYIPTRKIVDVLVCKIRTKIRAITPTSYLRTSWGFGYFVKSTNDDCISSNNDHHYDDRESLKTVVLE
jgi:DNA-binding response OmpR family regulator